MEKKQGFTASAILLTGLMLRPASTGGPPSEPLANRSPAPASESQASTAETNGPWRASCRYWRPGESRAQPAVAPRSSVQGGAPGSPASSNPGPSGSADTGDLGCGPDNWGLPVRPFAGEDLGITALIATVPDPLHSSMPMEFNRTIEALTEAASEYGYVESYYWLPWRRTAPEKAKSLQTTDDAETREDLRRERQPGLLILKQSGAIPVDPRIPMSPKGRNRVLYLFLVSQSPALGVNGAEIQNALAEELYLANAFGATLSFKQAGAARELDIIGPNNSGSAASLRAALDNFATAGLTFRVAGITSTDAALKALNDPREGKPVAVRYLAFGDNSAVEQQAVLDRFRYEAEDDPGRIAFLVESGTIFGQSEGGRKGKSAPLIIQFPRDISLLRNAQKADTTTPESTAATVTSPYLHLSLKDSSAEDEIPPFAPEVSAFSQEAQLMAIARELKGRRVRVVALSASNILDELFLLQFLHRDVPDTQVVVFANSDLLFARVGDNQPYVGSIALTVYPLTGLAQSRNTIQLHAFSDSLTEGLFNAAAYTFWDGRDLNTLRLADYENPFHTDGPLHPVLWATVLGRDGYYPLGVVDNCPSNTDRILPTIKPHNVTRGCTSITDGLSFIPQVPGIRPVIPAFTWYMLCVVVCLICVGHGLVLLVADFWSALTRDLAVEDSDQPRRRAVYVHIAAAVLFSMGFVTSFPLLPAWHLVRHDGYTVLLAVVTFGSGVFAAGATVWRTRTFFTRGLPRTDLPDAACLVDRRKEVSGLDSEAVFYPFFNTVAAATALLLPILWCDICMTNSMGGRNSYTGLFFSYRCLFPASGVSPLSPIILILVTWYIWAHVQTRRLRFSENSRPMLPSRGNAGSLSRLYVSDESLSRCCKPTDSCLYDNINCLLITRQLIRRAFPKAGGHLDKVLVVAYIALFAIAVSLRVHGLDHFFRTHIHPGPYEMLISALLFPLLLIAVSGCTRVVVIWAALKRGLLEPLERSPLRYSFSRLKNVGWMTMLRQGGLFEYWRDMTRSIESMQQLSHIPELASELHSGNPNSPSSAERAQASLQAHLAELQAIVRGDPPDQFPERHAHETAHAHMRSILKQLCTGNGGSPGTSRPVPAEKRNYLLGTDLPHLSRSRPLNLMCAIECDLSEYAQAVLFCVLMPHWLTVRANLVEADAPVPAGAEEGKGSPGSPLAGEPYHVQLAEEFVAIRYVSLIRAVLINLRFLVTFVSTAFVLALIAWNSYPFQPRQWVDWTFTIMLFGIGAAVVWVFAQMHRDSILSRVTGTNANELGGAFFLRLLTFGGVPFLTWLASQFPGIGSGIARLLQSGLTAAK